MAPANAVASERLASVSAETLRVLRMVDCFMLLVSPFVARVQSVDNVVNRCDGL